MLTHVDNLSDVLCKAPCFEVLASLSKGQGGYVVGGAVRDALLKRPVTDIDLIFPEDPTLLAKLFAKEVGGSWFWLDEQRRQSRVVAGRGQSFPDYDFAPFRAPTLGQDLLDRDFTINSIAIAIDEVGDDDVLIDPLCGLDDLHSDILRMASVNSFANDPLRILKGVRHATALGLSVEPETLGMMQKSVTDLYRVAPERIRQEVWKIFADDRLSDGLQVMSQAMVGNYLFGNGYSSCVSGLCAVFDRCRTSLDRLMNATGAVSHWFDEEIEQGLDKRTLLLWTLLLREVDHGLPLKLAEEWLLSRKAKATVSSLCVINEGHVDKFASLPYNKRSYAWWSGFLNVEPKLLLMALWLSSEQEVQVEAFFVKWVPLVESLETETISDMVDGNWLRSELGLNEGPEMARAQRLVRHAEISGEVKDKAGAQKLLRQYYANID